MEGEIEMKEFDAIKGIKESLQKAIELPKCRKCGCMEETLKTMKTELSRANNDDYSELLYEVKNSIEKIEPTQYT